MERASYLRLDGIDYQQPFLLGSLTESYVSTDTVLCHATAMQTYCNSKLQRIYGTESASPLGYDETLCFPIMGLCHTDRLTLPPRDITQQTLTQPLEICLSDFSCTQLDGKRVFT